MGNYCKVCGNYSCSNFCHCVARFELSEKKPINQELENATKYHTLAKSRYDSNYKKIQELREKKQEIERQIRELEFEREQDEEKLKLYTKIIDMMDENALPF